MAGGGHRREAVELRAAGIDGPILVMGALSRGARRRARGRTPTSSPGARTSSRASTVAARVHVKLDTGMGRLGTRDPGEATRVAEAVAAAPQLELAGAMTHFATADERGDAFFGEQLARFAAWALPLRDRHPGHRPARRQQRGALRDPAAHFDLVRSGIAVYGMDPFGATPPPTASSRRSSCAPTWPRSSRARRARARATAGASSPSARRSSRRCRSATATACAAALTNNADVLVGGRRVPLAAR